MKQILCFFFGHQYFVLQKFTDKVRKVGCKRCLMTWGMHDEVKSLIEWDDELEEFHSERGLSPTAKIGDHNQ